MDEGKRPGKPSLEADLRCSTILVSDWAMVMELRFPADVAIPTNTSLLCYYCYYYYYYYYYYFYEYY